jgi:hypothetical protein
MTAARKYVAVPAKKKASMCQGLFLNQSATIKLKASIGTMRTVMNIMKIPKKALPFMSAHFNCKTDSQHLKGDKNDEGNHVNNKTYHSSFQ